MHLAGLLGWRYRVGRTSAQLMHLALSVLLLVHVHAIGNEYLDRKLVDFRQNYLEIYSKRPLSRAILA